MDVYNISNPTIIPVQGTFIMADTNVVKNILNSKPPTLAFVEYLVTNGGILCISEKTFEEIHIINDHIYVNKKANSPTARSEQIIASSGAATAELSLILNNDVFYPDALPLDKENKLAYVADLKLEAKLCWPDAYILGTALHHGIPLLWTHDSDFSHCKVPGIGILTDRYTMSKFVKSGVDGHQYLGF